MPVLNTNFSEVDDKSSFPQIEVGNHTGIVSAMPELYTGKSGKDSIKVELTVHDEEDPSNGLKIWTYLGLADKPFNHTNQKRFALSCGVEVGPEGFNTDDAFEKECRFSVKMGEYNGEPSVSFDKFLIPGDETTSDGSSLDAFGN